MDKGYKKIAMVGSGSAWRKVISQPRRFSVQVVKAFQKNQGLLLSGALAYYILLSVIPLFTFLLLMLSHVVDETALLATLRRYIGPDHCGRRGSRASANIAQPLRAASISR
jgi:hypothetical protein